MSLEQDLKETLVWYGETTRPRVDAFDGVRHKVRRAHRRRLASIAMGGVALIAAAVIAIPQLAFDGAMPDPQSFATDAPSNVPVEADGHVTLRNEQVAYQLSFPAEWRVTRFEDAVELLPPDQIGLAAGEPTFSVEIMHLVRDRYDDVEGGWEDGLRLAGQPAVRLDIDFVEGSGPVSDGRVVTYRVDWTALPCPPESVCDSEISTLQVMVHASTQDLWDTFGEDALAAVEGLRWIRNAPMPTGEVRSPYGRFSGVTYDEATSVLQRFLDARVIGERAAQYLGPEATDSYRRDPDSGLGLYVDPETGNGWLSYAVTAREDGGGSATFQVELTYQVIEGHGPAGETEELVVSPGGRDSTGIYERGSIIAATHLGDFTA